MIFLLVALAVFPFHAFSQTVPIGYYGPTLAEEKTRLLKSPLKGLTLELKSPNSVTRFAAISVLGMRGAAAIPILREVLAKKDTSEWPPAMESLERIGGEQATLALDLHAKGLLPSILKKLVDPAAKKRSEAIAELLPLGLRGEPARAQLEKLVEDPDAFVAQDSSEALFHIGSPAAKKAFLSSGLPKLAKQIDADKSSVSPNLGARALEALGRLKPPPDEVLALLIKTLKSQNPPLQEEAARSLGKLQAPSSVVDLMRMLQDKTVEERVKFQVAWALRDMGTRAVEAVPLLISLFEKQWKDYIPGVDSPNYRAPLEAIMKIRPALGKKELVEYRAACVQRITLQNTLFPRAESKSELALDPELQKATRAELRDRSLTERDYRSIWVHDLGMLGDFAAPAVSLLVPLLEDRESEVRENAAWALSQIDSATKPLAKYLDKMLTQFKAATPDKACGVASELARLGKHADGAVRPIALKLGPADEKLRGCLLFALHTIQTPAARAVLLAALQPPVKPKRELSSEAKGT